MSLTSATRNGARRARGDHPDRAGPDATRLEFGVAIGTFSAVVAVGILVGILTAVFLSLALLIARISRPPHAVLGAADEGGGFQELPAGEPSEAAPGVVVYRFDAPLFFANADYFVDHAIKVFERAGPERFVLDFEAVTLVDVTAARALKRLLSEVESREAELSVARASRAVHQQMDEAGLVDAISESRFYPPSGWPFVAPIRAAGDHRDLRWATEPDAGASRAVRGSWRGSNAGPIGGSGAVPWRRSAASVARDIEGGLVVRRQPRGAKAASWCEGSLVVRRQPRGAEFIPSGG